MMGEQADTLQVGSLWQMRRHRGTNHSICQILDVFETAFGTTIKFSYIQASFLEYTQNAEIFTQGGIDGYARLS
jgi:hypothetical protein